MKPCAFTGQTLEQHSAAVAEIAKQFLEKGNLETICRRLNYAGIKTDRRAVYDMVLAAAVFHDVGKAIKPYQDQFDWECRCLKKDDPSFPFHEIFSTVYFKRVLSNNYNGELAMLALLAVLNHMHAIRDYENLVDVFNPEKNKPEQLRRIMNEAEIDDDTRCGLVGFLSGYGFSKHVLDEALGERVTWQDLYALGKDIEEAEQKIAGIRLYVLILLPVVVGDNLDAAARRRNDYESSSRRAFIEELSRCLGDYIYV